MTFPHVGETTHPLPPPLRRKAISADGLGGPQHGPPIARSQLTFDLRRRTAQAWSAVLVPEAKMEIITSDNIIGAPDSSTGARAFLVGDVMSLADAGPCVRAGIEPEDRNHRGRAAHD